MFDHISIGVSDIKTSGAFYDAVLKPLGYTRLSDGEGALGFGEAKNGSYIGGIGGGSILVPEQGSLIIACSKVKAAHLRVFPGASRIRNLGFLGAGGAAGRA